MKTKTPFGWDGEAEKAFQKLKEYLEKLPRMVSPSSNEPLSMYLAVSDYPVSAVLVVEKNLQQHPVYYVGHVLTRAELRYSLIEKFVYALLITSQKLRP